MEIKYLPCGCPEGYCICHITDENPLIIGDTMHEFDYDEFNLTEEDLQLYDDNCEEFEEQKRNRLQLEQEY